MVIIKMDTQLNIWLNKWKSQPAISYHFDYFASRDAFYPKYHTFTYSSDIEKLALITLNKTEKY